MRYVFAFATIVMLAGYVGYDDYQEAVRQENQYCEMVKLWKQTNGQAGWPAYNGEGVCK